MNLTTPPFDDVHVRKAMNLVMDLEGIQRAWGGPVAGNPPTHICPESLLSIPDYYPFQQPPFAGDVEAAKAEMAQSKYDTDQDGTCDAAPCKNVINLNRNFAPWSTISPIIEQSAAQIGITIETREAVAVGREQHVEHDGPEDPVQHRQRVGQGLRRPVDVLRDLRRAQHHPGREHRVCAGRGDQGPGAGAGVTVPPGGVRASTPTSTSASPHGPGAHRLLDGPRQEADRGDRPQVGLLDATSLELVGPAVTQYDYDQFGLEPSLARLAVDPSQTELRGGDHR